MDRLISNMVNLHGRSGHKWLRQLPKLLHHITLELNITLTHPIEQLNFNYVTRAIDEHGQHVILKCGFPDSTLHNEIAALDFFAGNSCVKLLASNAKHGWLLLEDCNPGAALATETHDDIATHNAIRVMQNLWHPAPHSHPFRSILSWLDGLHQITTKNQNQLPKDIILCARKLSTELQSSMGEQVVLHGDLHHHNILSAQRQPWLAIDPKGVIGEREYECGALLRNPLQTIASIASHADMSKLINRRLDIMCELTHFDRQRILTWTFVQAVLATWWHIDDKTDGADTMAAFSQQCYKLLK